MLYKRFSCAHTNPVRLFYPKQNEQCIVVRDAGILRAEMCMRHVREFFLREICVSCESERKYKWSIKEHKGSRNTTLEGYFKIK